MKRNQKKKERSELKIRTVDLNFECVESLQIEKKKRINPFSLSIVYETADQRKKNRHKELTAVYAQYIETIKRYLTQRIE